MTTDVNNDQFYIRADSDNNYIRNECIVDRSLDSVVAGEFAAVHASVSFRNRMVVWLSIK